MSLAPNLEEARKHNMDFYDWLQALIKAYRENCIVLQTVVGEDPALCDVTWVPKVGA